MMNESKISILICELKDDLRLKGFDLVLSEKGLYALEEKLSHYYQNNIIDVDYLQKFGLNILAYIGEVHIKKYGGSWVCENQNTYDDFQPIGIMCKNGRNVSDFIPVLNDILFVDIYLTKQITLSASYKRIEYDCLDGFKSR
jgi:hypothetical protein